MLRKLATRMIWEAAVDEVVVAVDVEVVDMEEETAMGKAQAAMVIQVATVTKVGMVGDMAAKEAMVAKVVMVEATVAVMAPVDTITPVAVMEGRLTSVVAMDRATEVALPVDRAMDREADLHLTVEEILAKEVMVVGMALAAVATAVETKDTEEVA